MDGLGGMKTGWVRKCSLERLLFPLPASLSDKIQGSLRQRVTWGTVGSQTWARGPRGLWWEVPVLVPLCTFLIMTSSFALLPGLLNPNNGSASRIHPGTALAALGQEAGLCG